MIGTTTLHLVAGHPDRPLETRSVFVGSALTERFVNVPRTIGLFSIEGVTLAVANADDVTLSVSAVRTGSLWSATIPASHFVNSGFVSLGRSVFLRGVDEAGVARTWCVGRGELAILAADGTISSNGTHINVHFVGSGTELPSSPATGDLYCLDGAGFRLWTGASWASFGAAGDFAVVDALDADAASTFEIASKLNQVLAILKG